MQVYWMKRTAEEEAERMRALHGNPDYTVEDVVIVRPSVGQKNGR